MSTLLTTNIKHPSAASNNVTLDSSGRFLVGTGTARGTFSGGTITPRTQIEAVGQVASSLSLTNSANEVSGSVLFFGKQRSGALGGNTAVSSGDELGQINFQGCDGNGLLSGASIQAFVDGTPSAGDMPCRLIFSTTADGVSYPTERMRITNSGVVSISGNGATGAGNNPKLYVDGVIENNAVAIFNGVQTRAGFSGAQGANNFNIGWTGSVAQLWVDSSNLGTITTSSDYRIKHKIQPMQSGCIDRVKQLRPVQYELNDYGQLFRADGVVREGFIAHEVQSVIPSGADGVKDEENRIQNLRTDAIVAVLTKALQEAIAKIETLETKVAALEAN